MSNIKSLIVLSAIFFSSVSNATLIHYTLSGEIHFADTDFDNPYTADIFGDMYVSDTPSFSADDTFWDIVSFAINAGDRGWGGSGTIFSTTPAEAAIIINDPSGSDWQTGSEFFSEIGWVDRLILPDVINWPGFGWYFGDEYFARIGSLNMTRVTTSVPEPTSLVLVGLGLAGITFTRRRKVS